MKKIVIAGIILIISAVTYGQHSVEYEIFKGKVKSIVQTNSFESGKFDGWDSSTDKFHFSENGKMLSQEHIYQGKLESGWYKEYNTFGEMIRKISFNGLAYGETIVKMDKSGRPEYEWVYINHENKEPSKTTSKPDILFSFTNDKRGNTLKKQFKEEGTTKTEWTKKYDDENRVTEYSFGANGYYNYRYVYDTAGQKIEERDFIEGRPNLITTFEYDKEGRITKEKVLAASQEFNSYMNKTTIYRYNPNGKLVEKKGIDYQDKEILEKYTYDKEGNITREEILGGRHDRINEYTYVYDKAGNWTKKEKYYSGGRFNADKEKTEVYTREISYY